MTLIKNISEISAKVPNYTFISYFNHGAVYAANNF